MIKTLFTLLLLNNHLNTSIADTTPKEIIFKIDFQDFFNNDTVTLRINNCLIFQEYQLMSDQSTGLTKARIRAYSDDSHNMRIVFNGRSQLCTNLKNKVSLSIVFNHCEKKYDLDLSNGKYIGISKKGITELSFRQAQKPFTYD